MPKELQIKLLNLDSEEYYIMIHVGPYVDSFAEVYENDDGIIVFSSEVYSDYPLAAVKADDVEVYKMIENWKEV